MISEPKVDSASAWSWTWKNPTARFVLLAPTALSAIAHLEDVGRIARLITAAWHPLLHAVESYVVSVFPKLPLAARDAVLLLFFMPFGLLGLVQFIRGKVTTVSPITSLLAAAAYTLLLALIEEGLPVGFLIETFLVPVVSAAIGSGLNYALNGSFAVPVFAMPLGVLSVWAIIISFAQGTSSFFVGLLAGLFALALPFFSPRRLADVAAIVIGILAISFTAEFAITWSQKLGLLK